MRKSDPLCKFNLLRRMLMLRPPKIRGIRIVENPFDDIVPRITAAEKKAQQQARLEAKKDMEVREKRAKAKKSDIELLGFGGTRY